MKFLRLLLITSLISIAVWRLAPHLGDFSKVLSLRDKINPIWLVMALTSQIGQYVGDGLLSQLLLKVIGFRISFKETVKIASLNVFAANILPVGEAGALATVFYFYRKLGVSVQQIIFLSACWSIITAGALITIFLLSLLFLPSLPSIPITPTYIIAGCLVALFIFLDFFVIERKILLPHLKRLLRKHFGKYSLYEELIKFKNNIPQYSKTLLSDKFVFTQIVFAAFIYYLANIATLSFSFLAFGHTPDLAVIATAYTLSLLLGWITLAPAGIGAAEATLILIFLHFKIDAPTALASVLVFRILNFWLPIPAGALSYFSLKREIAAKSANDK